MEPTASSNIVERRSAIRRSSDYFWLQRLCEVTNDGCLVVCSDLRIEYGSPRAAELLEIPLDAVSKGADFSTLTLHMAELGMFGPGDPRAFQALLRDLLVNQKMKQDTREHSLRVITPLGRQITFTIAHGQDGRFIIVVRDVTALHLESQALDTALKIGESGYWLYNLKSRELQHRVGRLMTEADFSALEDTSLKDLATALHPDDRAKSRKAIADCLSTHKPQVLTLRAVDQKERVYWLKAHMMPGMDEANRVRFITCFYFDVTAQLRVQDELRSAQQKAERALKAKNDFLGRLSHEIRTPMNAVIGMADAIIHHDNTPELTPKLELIQDSAEKIVRLVDESLQHTKLEESKLELDPREASLPDLLHRSAALWTDQAQKVGTDITVRVDPSVPDILVFDDFRLEQCINNLMSNAVKFTDAGAIDVVVGTGGTAAAPTVIIAVRDTGIGMDEKQLKQVFLPYRQADRTISGRFGGTGLGMAITKDLVELMGGRIVVRSEEGLGTTFAITLPLVRPQGREQGSDALVGNILDTQETGPADYRDLRVLIVDDNATNHMVVGSLLKDVVGHVVTAMNGEEAIERLEEEPFDVILMDIHMPVMDGIEATLAIRSTETYYMDVPIIALTADPQYQQARLCRNIGMDAALSKPVRLSALLSAFDEVLNGTGAEDGIDADAAARAA